MQKLSEALEEVFKLTDKDPLTALVCFFEVVSKWHEKIPQIEELIKRLEEINYGQWDDLIENFQNFKSLMSEEDLDFLKKSGKELSLEEKIHLGGLNDLPFRPISYWKKRKKRKKLAT